MKKKKKKKKKKKEQPVSNKTYWFLYKKECNTDGQCTECL